MSGRPDFAIGWSTAHEYAQAVLRVTVAAFVLSQNATPDDADELWRILGQEKYPETAGDAARMLSQAWAQVRAGRDNL